jgi:hypothetical protein
MTMVKKLIVTLHKIGITDPENPGLNMDGYNADGDPIMRKKTLRVPANTLYELDSEYHDIEDMLRRGTVRQPTQVELDIGKTAARPSPYFDENSPDDGRRVRRLGGA